MLKVLKPLSILLISSSLLFCCTASKNTEETTTDTTNVAEPSAEQMTNAASEAPSGNKIVLKGAYVTSVKMPHQQYDLANVFDGDVKTYWSTMPGAGPDEGIMLYFDEAVAIRGMEIIPFEGNSFSDLQSVSIYVNGQKVADDALLSGGRIAVESDDVKSMFIRLTSFADVQARSFSDLSIITYPSDKSSAIAEIKLFNDKVELKVIAPQKVEGSVQASSTLSPVLSYSARNLFDSKKEFVWAEGASGNGENQTITLSFKEEQQADGISILNGFQRSDKHYSANARVKKLTIANEAGNKVEVSVNDTQDEQDIRFSSQLKGKTFTITINEVYPGTSYKDLVISELKLLNGNSSFIITDSETEKVKTDLLGKIKGTVLENIIDKRIYNEEVTEYDGIKRSIILRSDYTFVLYQESQTETSSGEETNEVIGDGNWELKSADGENAKVRVFGKLMRMSETTDYYSGDNSTSYLQIFQDNLTINDHEISGDKFIEEIKITGDEGEN